MKKLVLLSTLFVFIISCTDPSDNIEGKVWTGSINSTKTDRNLSKVALFMKNDTLQVLANAIFGSKRDTLYYKSFENDSMVFKINDEGQLHLKPQFSDDKTDLTLHGKGYFLKLHSSDSKWDKKAYGFYKNKPMPSKAYMYLDNTYEGTIYRIKDNKPLSQTKFKIANDSLIVFSNAIFGRGNDTLILNDFRDSDTVFQYVNKKNKGFFVNLSLKDVKGKFYLIGSDFFISYNPISRDAFNQLEFYKKMNVPRDADLYVDGVYKGRLEGANSFETFAMESSMGSIKLRIEILNNFKLKFQFENMMASMFGGEQKPEILNYSYNGEYLIIHRPDKTNRYKIVDNGNKLVMVGNSMKAILTKVY